MSWLSMDRVPDISHTHTNLLKLISHYSKAAGQEVNTERSISFLYTSSEQLAVEVKSTTNF